MNINYLDYNLSPQLSSKDQDYISLKPFLEPYYSYVPDLGSFEQVMSDRKKHKVDRSLLQKVLRSSYASINSTKLQQLQIDSLASEDTFTVITAHQPSLLGGPLYYILKIASTINLTRQLTNSFTDQHIIPVFINGSEDHDFEEIDHFSIFGKTITWNREARGPVGRMSVEGLDKVISETKDILGDSANAQSIIEIFEKALKSATSYNDFVFRWVTTLFADTELLVINTDHADLKRNFIPILRKEIIERPSQQIVLDTQEELTNKGFKAQAHPRDINLFYLGQGDRQRITFEDGKYQIVDSSLSFSEFEILEELDKHPEHFSPNVVIRPLYQEFTLPNLAYIGGGGEIAYWLERKRQFEHFGVFYPMLIRRNSAVIVSKGQQKQLSKLDLTLDKIFNHTDLVINNFLSSQSDTEISINDEKDQIEAAFKSMAKKAKVHDPTVAKAILAEMTKQIKGVDNLGGRIKRSLKAKEEVNVNRIKKLKDTFFPNDGLQERRDNFMQFYSSMGPDLIDFLIDNLDPLDKRFSIITE